MNKREKIFNKAKNIAAKTELIRGVVQNPMLPEEVDLEEFKKEIQRIKRELTDYQNEVLLYFVSIGDEEKERIKQEQLELSEYWKQRWENILWKYL